MLRETFAIMQYAHIGRRPNGEITAARGPMKDFIIRVVKYEDRFVITIDCTIINVSIFELQSSR